MKDLYTFDYTPELALQTYNTVREAYGRFFDEFKIPYLVAEADSGNMGGNLSHEFHIPINKGEDHIISCSNCQFVANEELAESKISTAASVSPLPIADTEIATWTGVTSDRLSLVVVYYPRVSPQNNAAGSPSNGNNEVNLHAVKAVIPMLDTRIENPLELWKAALVPCEGDARYAADHSTVIEVFDGHIPSTFFNTERSSHYTELNSTGGLLTFPQDKVSRHRIRTHPTSGNPLNLLRTKDGDPCTVCDSGSLKIQRAVELGHTFFLGSRYSDPLRAFVAVPSTLPRPISRPLASDQAPEVDVQVDRGQPALSTGQVALEMGCHGIGITRLIGTVAESLADEKGLNWPRVMAPFEVVIISRKGLEVEASEVYDVLTAGNDVRHSYGLAEAILSTNQPLDDAREYKIDAVLDDRPRPLAWKLEDADLIGYPVIVILGKTWVTDGQCEVQCRRLNDLQINVLVQELKATISSMLAQL
ncbi:MAG: hypothetical protein M1827_006530 [Pycnora praestabilis]|nr:MAG: hypothetical protein M1827_006530 [Pycnora praestabilis]